MPEKRASISVYSVACIGLALFLCSAAPAAFAAATVFPERQTGPFRDSSTVTLLDKNLSALMEIARTRATADDMILGRVYDLGAALRYPLSGSDALAAFLDSLPAAPDVPQSVKNARETALQLARVILNEEIDNTRAQLRAIRDLRAAEPAAPTIRTQLLDELEKNCFTVGTYLQNLNKRCRDSRYTAPIKGNPMLFLDETAANAAQEHRKAFLDRLETDRANQDFIGAGISEKVTALRFPFRDTIRTSFFLERLFEASDDDTARQTALALATTLFERHLTTTRMALAHIQAISNANAADSAKVRLLQNAANLYQATITMLSDTAERCRRQSGRL